mgnify:FL=1|tara:strand:+ start:72 stop:263 length:192 start_codon:yes stop_codon:yes gene_type:complete
MQVNKIKCSSELMRQRNTPNEEAFKVTLQGLTLNEVERVAEFVTNVLMKNRNHMAYKYGRMYE